MRPTLPPSTPAIRRILAVTAAAYGLDPAVDHRRARRRERVGGIRAGRSGGLAFEHRDVHVRAQDVAEALVE